MEHHGKGLAAFLKAIGVVIRLMKEEYANEEMKKIVLKVIKQCVATAGVEPEYIQKEILPEFFVVKTAGESAYK
eukprot:15078956-Ditylum_brightwellii.AAC.1